VKAAERQKASILDGPLDGLAPGEVHGLSESGGEVDVPLFAGFAFDELDFGWERHAAPYLVIQLDIRKCDQPQQELLKMFFI
jgi:hypothetical protein